MDVDGAGNAELGQAVNSALPDQAHGALQTAAAAAAEDDAAQGDLVWDPNARHVRQVCSEHAFYTTTSTANCTACNSCVCFICEVPARQCQLWGMGNSRLEHCNAWDDGGYYTQTRDQRRHRHALLERGMAQRQAQAQGQAGPADAQAPAPGLGLAQAATMVASQALIRELQQPAGSPAAAAPLLPFAAAQAAALSMVELGTIRLVSKVVGNDSLAGLRKRVTTCGFYSGPMRSESMYGRLGLENVAAKIWDQTVMEALPMRLFFAPLGLDLKDKDLTVKRTRRVMMVHYDGCEAACTKGVSIHKNARIKTWLAAAARAFNVNFAEHELIPFFLRGSELNFSTGTRGETPPGNRVVPVSLLVGRDLTGHGQINLGPSLVVHESQANNGMVTFRVPSREALGWGGLTTSPPVYALIHHRKKSDPQPVAPYTFGYNRNPPKLFGHPVLLPLPRGGARGGPEVAVALIKALLDSLAPYRKDGSFRDIQGTRPTLLRCSTSAYVQYRRPQPPLEEDPVLFSNERDPPGYHESPQGSTYIVEDKLFLLAEWDDAVQDEYDLAAWTYPHVDQSASERLMAETSELLKADEARVRKRKECNEKPVKLITELVKHCKAQCPTVAPVQSGKWRTMNPMARCRFALVSPSAKELEYAKDCFALVAQDVEDEPDDDILPVSLRVGRSRCPEGARWLAENAHGKLICNAEYTTAAITVFVWRSAKGGERHKPFFEDPCHWPVRRITTGRRSRSYEYPLRHTMNALLRGVENYDAYMADLEAAQQTLMGVCDRGINNLMKMVETGERPEADQPEGLAVELHPYQRQSLRVMLDCESGEGGWRQRLWLLLKAASGERYWFSPLLQRGAWDVPAMSFGGFLAEEMGLGKTVEVLALTLANPAPALTIAAGVYDHEGLMHSRATLVMCAVSLEGQWIEEAKTKLNRAPRVCKYHGQCRVRDVLKLANNYDLVIATYQTLGSDFQLESGRMISAGLDVKKDRNYFPPLGRIKWHRVVLDESHTIKFGNTKQAKACIALSSDRRWCVSGTPLNTDINDLLSQFNFLGLIPFGHKPFFDLHVRKHYELARWGFRCFRMDLEEYTAEILLFALRRCMIRHTAASGVLRLPPKTEDLVPVELTQRERGEYMRCYADANTQYQRYKTAGPSYVTRHLLQIMSLLNPLRLICSGGALRTSDVTVPTLPDPHLNDGGAKGGRIAHDEAMIAPDEDCAVCLNPYERPTKTVCNHWFCMDCILGVISRQAKCPLCRRAPLRRTDLTEGTPFNPPEPVPESAVDRAGIFMADSKLDVLMRQLAAMRAGNPNAKALVFTQFATTLEWLKVRLQQQGYSFCTVTGSMTQPQRAREIKAFQSDPAKTVFLLTMRAGAVGINLTMATHVLLLEPALNPALEDQAIGRAWRMGQMNLVTVRRLYVKGSIEECIMEVGRQLRESASQADPNAPPRMYGYGNYARTPAGEAVIPGNVVNDRQGLRLDEMDMLFSAPEFPPLPIDVAAEAAAAAAAADAAAAAPAVLPLPLPFFPPAAR
ncbi:hypothetical protein WJX81_000554 [Elliptochloris bilobata]|uniref:SNF2 super family n=1 Tax=Elliptochloris bilobata TaxID=381761 RepID=A0AAW1R0X5_9CHLO